MRGIERKLLLGVELLRLVQPPGRPFDVDDGGVVDHPIHRGCGDHRIPQVVPECLEVDVGCQDCRALAVAAVDHLVEEVRVSRLALLQAVEAHLVYQEHLGREEALELRLQALVGESREQFLQHRGGSRIAAAEVFLAADEQERLGKMALAGAGVAGKDHPLLAPSEVEAGEFHDLPLVYAGLEDEVEVSKELQFRQLRLLDAPLDPAFGERLNLPGKEPFQHLPGGRGVLRRTGKLLIESCRHPVQFQCFQIAPDSLRTVGFLHGWPYMGWKV